MALSYIDIRRAGSQEEIVDPVAGKLDRRRRQDRRGCSLGRYRDTGPPHR